MIREYYRVNRYGMRLDESGSDINNIIRKAYLSFFSTDDDDINPSNIRKTAQEAFRGLKLRNSFYRVLTKCLLVDRNSSEWEGTVCRVLRYLLETGGMESVLSSNVANGWTYANGQAKAFISETLPEAKEYYRQKGDEDRKEAYGTSAKGCGYEVEHITDFYDSHELGKLSGRNGKGELCFTSHDDMWESFSGNGKNKCYVLLSPDYKDVPAEPTEGHPYDRYGLSTIWVFIDPQGNLAYSNLRWNHESSDYIGVYRNGGTDHALTFTDIAKICGSDVVRQLLPYSDEELTNRGAKMAESVNKRLAKGFSIGMLGNVEPLYDSYGIFTHRKGFHKSFYDYDTDRVSGGYNDIHLPFLNGYGIVVNMDGTQSFYRLSENGPMVFEERFPYIDDEPNDNGYGEIFTYAGYILYHVGENGLKLFGGKFPLIIYPDDNGFGTIWNSDGTTTTYRVSGDHLVNADTGEPLVTQQQRLDSTVSEAKLNGIARDVIDNHFR